MQTSSSVRSITKAAQSRRRALRAATALILALACKSAPEPKPEPEPTPPDDPAFVSCTTDADCGFGEISSEILSSRDCPCLYGCPYLPLNRATIERRQSQYDAVCDPGFDGNGHGCGIDDCAAPPAPACVAGRCGAASASTMQDNATK